MSVRNTVLSLNEYYHVYNRGTEKRTIFQDAADHDRFIELLFLSNGTNPFSVRDVRENLANIFDFDRGTSLVYIGAYCLMPNHFHVLLTPAVEGGIQKFMLKLSTGYSMYFNKKYERTGALFEGRFKSEHADTDEYLKYLFSYIHLNPVKLIQSNWKETGIRDVETTLSYLEGYTYSSFIDYVVDGTSPREEMKILNKEKFPEYFSNSSTFTEEILEWIQFDPTASP